MRHDFDFYETPDPLTAWLFREIEIRGQCYEPCVGSGAILRAVQDAESRRHGGEGRTTWRTNDLDTRWSADTHLDATGVSAWLHDDDWCVTNPPFGSWTEIATEAIRHMRVGVAMYLRLSANEPKKTEHLGWWTKHPPSDLLICPRFAHQRSRRTGEWATDSVTCCWTVWRKQRGGTQTIRYAPLDVIEALKRYTPKHRARMDEIMRARSDDRRTQGSLIEVDKEKNA